MTRSSRGWFARHPAPAAVLAVLAVLWLVGAVVADEQPGPTVRGDAVGARGTDPPGGRAGGKQKERTPARTKQPAPEVTAKPSPPSWSVAYVVDGDTIKLTNGESVRLVGIDTPERGECGFEESTRALERIIGGHRVHLGMSDEDRDGYGRLLRYVDVDGRDAGLALIRAGLAVARYDSRDGYGFHPREPRYIAADEAAADLCPRGNRPPEPQPLVQGGSKGTGGGACAPGYTPCLPAYPPDIDCADVGGPVRVTGEDPHGLDRDGDGIACE